MKATARAPANIAFIKYWGKQDEKLRLPLNASFSMNLSGAFTTTTVEFSKKYTQDIIEFVSARHAELVSASKKVYRSRNEFGMIVARDEKFSLEEKSRIIKHLDLIRAKAGISAMAKVFTQNSFPKGAGAAASASGFAALTMAAATALGLALSEKELTMLARIGSGSACRSIPDGFVMWEKGTGSESSYAYSLYPSDYWDLRDVLVIVASEMKKFLSTEGMSYVQSSPFLQSRLRRIPEKINRIQELFSRKDFPALGELIEKECLNMHAVMMTQAPPIFYWMTETLKLIHAVYEWRAQGLPVYFTIDAGPNVHLICEAKDEQKVIEKVKQLGIAKEIVVNMPADGTKIIEEHLF